MIFIKCDEAGRILAIGTEAPASDAPDRQQWTVAAADDARVQQFCRDMTGGDSELSRSDASFIRVLEDLINLLVDRSVIMFTDLPLPAQEKLMARRDARARLHGEFGLLDDAQKLI